MNKICNFFCEKCHSILQVKDGKFVCVLCKNSKKIEDNQTIFRISYAEENENSLVDNSLRKYDIYKKTKTLSCKKCNHNISLFYSNEEMNTSVICEKCGNVI